MLKKMRELQNRYRVSAQAAQTMNMAAERAWVSELGDDLKKADELQIMSRLTKRIEEKMNGGEQAIYKAICIIKRTMPQLLTHEVKLMDELYDKLFWQREELELFERVTA